MSTTWVDTMAVGGAAIETVDSASGQAPAHAAAQGSLQHGETGLSDKSDAAAWARDQQQELADDERHEAWLDGDAKRPAPAKPRGAVRGVAALSAAGKPQNMCMYELCPSPMHSNKWRTVTSTTGAGGRDEDPFNRAAIDFVRRLPGVTDANYRRVMDAVERPAA